eukprot:5009203-Pyramimonas_sp.AAC.1
MIPGDTAYAAVPPLVYRAPRKRQCAPTRERSQDWSGQHLCSIGGERGSALEYQDQRSWRPT